MCSLSWEHNLKRNYEDINSFEPYYLKDFQTTLPKKINNKIQEYLTINSDYTFNLSR